MKRDEPRASSVTRMLSPAALALGAMLASAPADAIGFNRGGEEPIAIEAEEGIEWQSEQKVYIARGNARATQGELTVAAESLTAHYRESETGEAVIYRLEAAGDVLIVSGTERASGENAVYDVDNGVLVLTGKEVTYETEKERISADNSIEYWERRQLAVARGNAVAVRDNKTLHADVISAHLRDDAAGKLEMYRVEAFENVEVATPTEVARARYGNYDVKTGIATLSGAVKLTKGKSQLNGEFAEVNLNTGVSRLLSSARKAGTAPRRVFGLFSPKEKPTSP
ncbi:MAG: LptA/OstA family protein [Alphaproteobacteria bacterium]